MKKLNKKGIIFGLAALLLLVLIWKWVGSSSSSEKELYATVKKADFEITVFTTGELEAKNSVNVYGPQGINRIGVWQVKISDIIPEGTVVKEGDYIADLDKSEIANQLKTNESEFQKAESQYQQTKLDTTLQLRQARDELVNLKFSLKEKEIIVQQSIYEPPATIKQAELDYEKTKRSYEQSVQNYKIKESQYKAKMQEASANLSQVQSKLSEIQELMGKFTVTAPKGGMLIYEREWNGQKKVVGSSVSAWDPVVATLPDLSTMISKTYVNEVDIRKIKVNQIVNMTLDAFPEKKLSGTVVSVANVGEQNPKSDAKVFEVKILVNQKDTSLRPAMTTGNNIQVGKIKNVLQVPLECVHSLGDSIKYVVVHDGIKGYRQQVVLGQTNENFAIVKQGVEEGKELYLSLPEGAAEWELKKLTIKPKSKAN